VRVPALQTAPEGMRFSRVPEGSAHSEPTIGGFAWVGRGLRCCDDRQARSAPSSTIHWCSG
jgi:hypothetical protein